MGSGNGNDVGRGAGDHRAGQGTAGHRHRSPTWAAGGWRGPTVRPRRTEAPGRAATALLVVILAGSLLAACGRSRPSAATPAAVRITATAATFTDAGGRLVLRRSPVRLQVQDAAGRTVLADGVAPAGAPVQVPPTTDPVAPGRPNRAAVPSYAPLAFLVGSQTIDQYNGGFFGGDLRSATFGGTEYAATAVRSVRRSGHDLVATLATNDPSGRHLVLTVSAAAGGRALAVSVRADPATGVAMIGDSFGSTATEGFFGFGGVHDGLDQHGRMIDSWVAEEDVNGLSAPGQGGAGTSLYPDGPTAAYDPQAGFVSSRGYGFLVTDSSLTRFRLDVDRPDAWNVRTSGSTLDYVVAPGDPTQAMAALTAVNGRQPAPPSWALGPQLDREVSHSAGSTAAYQGALFSDLLHITSTHLPLTAYRIEGWANPAGESGLSLPAATTPAVLASTVKALQKLGIHPLFYLRPWIEAGSPAFTDHLVATTASGAPYRTTGTTGQPIGLLDPTAPAAVRWWDGQVDHVLDLGADGFMLDFGEQVLTSMHFADGQTGATMHNEYPVLMAKITRAAITAYEHRHPGRTIWFYTRSGYSGTPGSAAYTGGNFPGDEETSWSASSGLASLAPDMLNRALLGDYGYGTDIGGYLDVFTPATTAQLFVRWAEWAALSPVFRLHGSALAGTHTPWSYGPAVLAEYTALSKLHERAAPTIEALWRQADRTGVPPTRPVWLTDPSSAAARHADQEWLLGNDVLVAPVVTEGATSRSVWFPPGCWAPQDGLGATVHGAGTQTVPAPLDTLPYWFRCGTRPF